MIPTVSPRNTNRRLSLGKCTQGDLAASINTHGWMNDLEGALPA